jgi:hypothetical protein
MEIWKAALKTEAAGADDKLREEARAHCFAQRLVGLGWGLRGLLAETGEPGQYLETVAGNAEMLRGEWKWNLAVCRQNHRRFAHPDRRGDLVWSRSTISGYWIGKICGPWQYGLDPILTRYDLNQWRACQWFQVGDAANVPGAVRNQFAGPGGSFTRMSRGGETLRWLSAEIYRRLSGERLAIDPPHEWDIMANIGHDDLEDLVGLYLQHEHHWCIVPTTAKHATVTTECSLKNADGQTAWVQVKAAHAAVPRIADLPDGIDRFFIFEARPQFNVANQPTGLQDRLEVVLPNQVLEWANEHRPMLPLPVRMLLDHADAAAAG